MEDSSLPNSRTLERWKSESGAVLVFTGLAVLALTGFLVFVIDQGILLVARGQLQNAADAGALAGAVARTFDNPTTPFNDTVVSATQTALANPAFGDGASSVVVDPNLPCPVNGSVNDAGSCVRVDVFRDGTNASDPLPVIFGSVLDIASQGAMATATAQAANANATSCFKPFLVPDNFVDASMDGRYDSGELYEAPWSGGTGTGYTTADLGAYITLERAAPADPPEFFHYVMGGTVADLLANIENCQLTQIIGSPIDRAVGAPLGDITTGITTLTMNGPFRIVIGLYDPAAALADPGGPLQVVNLVGFEVSGIDGSGSLSGRIVGTTGELRPGSPAPGGEAGLVRAIRLLR